MNPAETELWLKKRANLTRSELIDMITRGLPGPVKVEKEVVRGQGLIFQLGVDDGEPPLWRRAVHFLPEELAHSVQTWVRSSERERGYG